MHPQPAGSGPFNMMFRPRAAVAFAVLACALMPAPARAATTLYPDLKTVPPSDLRFDSGTLESGGEIHYVLRFSNTVWNGGQGPFEIHGTPGVKNSTVSQRIFDDAGGFSDVAVSTDLAYHPGHGHFHLQDFAEYELWTKADFDAWTASGRKAGQAKHFGTKTSFCIMDTRRLETLPGTPSSRVYSQCGSTVQGLSVGWGDTYRWSLPEQWVDLGVSPLPDGSYVLRSIADPLNKLYESPKGSDATRESAQANEATTTFTVQRGRIRAIS